MKITITGSWDTLILIDLFMRVADRSITPKEALWRMIINSKGGQ